MYRGNEDTESVIIFGKFLGGVYDGPLEKNEMERVLDTNIWYKTLKARNDIKCIYYMSPNYFVNGVKVERPEYIDDPLGIQKKILPNDDEYPQDENPFYNILEMPNSMKYYWTVEKENITKGTVEFLRMKSEKTNTSHRVWVYIPHNYNDSGRPYKTMIVTDGFSYVVSTPTLLNNLIHENKIPPMIVIFVECEKKRNEFLQCNEEFEEFIVNEVLNECRLKYNISNKAEDNIIGGISLGGLFAADMALKYPDVFGNILSQSGSLWWYAEHKIGDKVKVVDQNELNYMAKKYENQKNISIKAYIELGTLETCNMMKGNRDLRDVLLSKGCNVEYSEFQGGHNYLSWK